MCDPCDGIDAPTLDRMNAEMTPPPEVYENDAKTEAKVTEVAVPLDTYLRTPTGGWHF